MLVTMTPLSEKGSPSIWCPKKSICFYHKIVDSLQILNYFNLFLWKSCVTHIEKQNSFSFTVKNSFFILTCLCDWDTFAFMFIYSDNADIQANGLWQIKSSVLRCHSPVNFRDYFCLTILSYFFFFFPKYTKYLLDYCNLVPVKYGIKLTLKLDIGGNIKSLLLLSNLWFEKIIFDINVLCIQKNMTIKKNDTHMKSCALVQHIVTKKKEKSMVKNKK